MSTHEATAKILPFTKPNAVTRGEFLRTINGADTPQTWVTSGYGNWHGQQAGQCNVDDPSWDVADDYYSVGVMLPGSPTRAIRNWSHTHIITIDDVEEKASADRIRTELGEPSYVMQTSLGSQQWGYLLDAPLRDETMQNRIIRAITIAFYGGKDPGHKDIVRYVRLPRSVNSKPSRVAANGGKPQGVFLREWHPELRHSVMDLCTALGAAPGLNGGTAWAEAAGAGTKHAVTLPWLPKSVAEAMRVYLPKDYILAAFNKLGRVVGLQGPQGYIEVTCPWAAAHSETDDRTAWNPALFLLHKTGFSCFHTDNGADKSNAGIEAVLKAELDAQDGPGSFDALKLAADNAPCEFLEKMAPILAAEKFKQAVDAFAPTTPSLEEQKTLPGWDAGMRSSATADRGRIEVWPGQQHIQVRKGLDAIAARGGVFQRARAIVKIGRAPSENGDHDALAIINLNIPNMTEELSAAAQWVRVKTDASTGNKTDVVANVPDEIPGMILNKRDDLRLPLLNGIVCAPFMQRDGTVVQADGAGRYDPASRQWIDPRGVAFRPVLDSECTLADAQAALKTLMHPLRGYVFDGPVSEAVAAAIMLAPLMRSAVDLVPGIVIDGPGAGLGKTKLAGLAGVLATGHTAPPIAPSARGNGEMDNQLTAALLDGRAILCLDNLKGEQWGSELLCSAITSESILLRRLGTGNQESVRNTFTLLATANNATIPGDMSRRCLVCRIDPKVERPSERQFPFDPIKEAQRDRAKLIHAGLTILRGYVLERENGQAVTTGRPMGSFEEYTALVRDALMWVGMEDIAKSTEAAMTAETLNPDLLAVLTAWSEAQAINVGAHTVSDIFAAAEKLAQGGAHDLMNAISRACDGRPAPRVLGDWLRANKGKFAGGMSIIAGGLDPRRKVARWQLDGQGAKAGDAPVSYADLFGEDDTQTGPDTGFTALTN